MKNFLCKSRASTPKLYFYDTGVACSLLGIQSTKTLALSPFRGNLFENLIVSDLFKQYYNHGYRPSLYFWRDKNGRIEVDILIDRGDQLFPVEIKSGQTITQRFFDSLERWNEISKTPEDQNRIIYGGSITQKRSKGIIIGWKDATTLIPTLYDVKAR